MSCDEPDRPLITALHVEARLAAQSPRERVERERVAAARAEKRELGEQYRIELVRPVTTARSTTRTRARGRTQLTTVAVRENAPISIASVLTLAIVHSASIVACDGGRSPNRIHTPIG